MKETKDKTKSIQDFENDVKILQEKLEENDNRLRGLRQQYADARTTLRRKFAEELDKVQSRNILALEEKESQQSPFCCVVVIAMLVVIALLLYSPRKPF